MLKIAIASFVTSAVFDCVLQDFDVSQFSHSYLLREFIRAVVMAVITSGAGPDEFPQAIELATIMFATSGVVYHYGLNEDEAKSLCLSTFEAYRGGA